MGVLDQITQMRNKGIPEEEIIQNLQETGISPKAINDALSQSRIKKAVSGENEEEMQESIMDSAPSMPYSEPSSGGYTPSTEEIPEEDIYYPPQQEEGGYAQDYYPEETYEGYAPAIGADADTIIEISEQVFSEKIQKIQKQIEDFSEFRTLAQTRIESISERIKRIETTIDKLQINILEKIGFYGKDIGGIKKEMEMMQDSFGKIVNPLLDKTERKHASHTTHPTKKKHSKKKK
ncbi:MAG: hypothetical protein KKF68_01235 [Nanoarchaeota archaeon]|nr:hypothetical protein [Nanoarchaeota archaeon]